MSKPRDAAKERFWRGVLRRWSSSRLGTREFCDGAGVPEHQLHWWRRTLERRDQEAGYRESDLPELLSRSAFGDSPGTKDCRSPGKEQSPFIRVVLPETTSTTGATDSGNLLEVVHPGGCLIRVPEGCDSSLLARVLSVLDATSRFPEGGL